MADTTGTADRPEADEWIAFPGGELEGKRPKAMCPACREAIGRSRPGRARSGPRVLCFLCYRAELERQRALKAAADLETASDGRFQFALPFEAVNAPRLQMLKARRASARQWTRGARQYEERRRHAQIEARHALQAILAGVRSRSLSTRDQDVAFAIRAAELPLPESWLPFVVSR